MKQKTAEIDLPAPLDAPRAQVANVPLPDGRVLKIHARLKRVLDAMVFDGLAWNEAAEAHGMRVRSVRIALKKRHVLRYLREQRSLFRAALSARNEFVAGEIRDKGENAMARLGALRYLDGLPEGDRSGSDGRIVQPGVVVVISPQPTAYPVDNTLIEVNPQSADAEALA